MIFILHIDLNHSFFIGVGNTRSKLWDKLFSLASFSLVIWEPFLKFIIYICTMLSLIKKGVKNV